jgi:SseB protein N-terminal domain
MIDPKQIPLEPANELEGVMIQVAAGTREEADFFARLWESKLLVPQEGEAGDELRELPAEPGAEVALPVLRAHGRRTVPVYSSENQMLKRAPQEWSSFLRLGMPALQQMLAGSNTCLFINPRGDLSTMLDPLQVAALPDHRPPAEKVAGDATVRAVDPGELPQELLAPVREFSASRPTIRAVYAAELDERLAVGLVLDPGVSSAEMIAAAETELTRPGIPSFGMMVIDDTSPGRLGEKMLEGRPIYER